MGKPRQAKSGNSESAQVLQSNRMGTVLCFHNPMEDKICKREWKRIEQSRARRDVSHYLMQKNFLVTQFFEKGLNPCMSPKSRQGRLLSWRSQAEKSRRTSKDNDDDDDDNDVPQDDTPVVPQEDEFAGGNPSLVRSQTMGDLRERPVKQVTFKDQQGSGGGTDQPLPGQVASNAVVGGKWDFSTFDASAVNKSSDKLPPIPDVNPRTKSMLNINLTADSSGSSHLPPVQENKIPETSRSVDTNLQTMKRQIPPAASAPAMTFSRSDSIKDRRDLDYFRSHPDDLFPKMKSLMKRGPAENMFGSADARPADNLTDKRSQKPKESRKSASGETSATQKYVRLIQKLTAFLPPHLVETAKNQIRDMSNSEAIYARKERLLSENKEQNTREKLMRDDRWRYLQDNLCPNYGIILPWRRQYENHWSQQADAAQATGEHNPVY